jgi:hypothetical protein
MLKSGKFQIESVGKVQINLESNFPIAVVKIDPEGNPVDILARSDTGKVKMKIHQDELIEVVPGNDLALTSVDVFPIQGPNEPVDSVPYEVPEDNRLKMTLEEKLKVYLAEMVAERYGEDSSEYDTFEESMDFGDDEDMPAMTTYEESMMTPQEPIEPAPDPVPDPAPDPAPDSAPEPDPSPQP